MKPLYSVAISFLVFAIVADFVAKSKYADLAVSIAKSDAPENRTVIQNAARAIHSASYGFALIGIVFWVISSIRKERCGYIVLWLPE